MYFFLLFYLTFGLSCIQALSLPQLTKKSPASVISLDLELEASELVKRRFETTDFESRLCRFMVTFYLGSNKQKTKALIDSSSFPLNVYKNQYDPRRLRTAKDLNTPFETVYHDNHFTGKRYEDKFMFPGGTSMNLEFGLINANGPDIETPLGLAVGDNKKQSILWLLKQANKIGKMQYSLYVDQFTSKGKLIFGGIDKSKYSGTLIKNPMILELGAINLVNIRIGNQKKTINKEIYFDCGCPYGLLDASTYDWFTRVFKLRGDSTGMQVINCNQPTNKFVTFRFRHSVISIPYKNLAIPTNSELCLFAFTKSDVNILGSWFMKDLYTSFDYSDNTLAIAPYKPTRALNLVAA